MEYRQNQDWTNWSQSIQRRPERTYTPRRVGELTEIIRTAQRARKRVRAVGSGWSFSDVMATGDYMVDTTDLSGILAFSQGSRAWGPVRSGRTLRDRSPVLPEALTDAVRRSDRKLVHVLAGTKIKEVYTALDRPSNGRGRWALQTMGGASGQSLAGAISTGTHGGDFDGPPIADMVQAIHLVGPDGNEHWIERGGAGAITDRARLAAALRSVSADNIHYDDDWFNSVLVSMGTMGIIYAFVIEARDQFGLSEDRRETTWSDLKPMLASGEIFTSTRYSAADRRKRWIEHHPEAADRTPKGLGVFINPYRVSDDYSERGDAERNVVLITQAESSRFDGAHTPTGGASIFDLFHIIKDFESAGNLTDTRAVVDRVIASLRQDAGTDGKYRIGYSVLDTTTSEGSQPVLSLEIAVSTVEGKHVEFIDHMLEIFDGIMRDRWARGIKAKFAGGINLRYTRPTAAYLGMSHSSTNAADERCCYIEVIVAREQWVTGRPLHGEGSDYTKNEMENFTEDFTDAFERSTDAFDARLHWGQLSRTNRFDPDRYARFDAWLEVRNALTNNRAIRTFENDFSLRHLSPQGDVALRAPNGKYVAAEGGGGRELIANRDHRRTWETFKLIEVGTNRAALRAHDGHYVCAEGGGGGELIADRPHISGWETFSMIRLGDDKAVFRARNGRFVGLDSNGRLVADKRAINAECTFQVVEIRPLLNLTDLVFTPIPIRI